MRRLGLIVLACGILAAIAAPILAPYDPGRQFRDRPFAPPMRVHVRDRSGIHRPFVYRQVLDNRIERKYSEDRTTRVPLLWFSSGHLVAIDQRAGPLLLAGADALGRDVLSRLLYGARLSLGVTALGAFAALVIGAAIGGVAGTFSGRVDALLMLMTDFVLVLPGVYLVLVLRALLPLTLSTHQVFWLMAILFAVAGWPHVARGVRAIVAVERARDYAEAARAIGAGPIRLVGHLLPAARGFLLIELVLLIPALLLAEATISFLGLGFPEPAPSWGTMLQEAASVNGLLAAPWTLTPAVLLFLTVFSVQLAGGTGGELNLLRSATDPDPTRETVD
jgi:peptide/nickel transport system permease protein